VRALLIANPVASAVTDAQRRVAQRALEATFDLDVVSTNSRGHAAAIAREAAEAGAKAVIAYGGDGTVNEVVNGLVAGQSSSDVILGLLPGGGTNVLARTLGYPNTLVEATDHLLRLAEDVRVRRLNIGRLCGDGPSGPVNRLFTFAAGVGLDAETVRRVDASGLRPRLGDTAFLYQGVRAFFALRKSPRPPLVIETSDGDVEAWWAMLAKSDPFTFFGSRPLRVTPRARHDCGLDLLAGRTNSWTRTLRWFSQTFRHGRQVHDEECLYLHDVQSCALRAREPVPLQTDGEYLGAVTDLRAEVVPSALAVFA
jgi:diacylglycerol kinase family enzyme